ncbi:MAG: ABC transporter permease subunit [Anaerolineales bacterium]|nr:ABC transporter permease subunit [Anaerolineales bacterium]
MRANLELQPVREWDHLRGFSNLFWKENRGWWRTHLWWINMILWSGALGGLIAMIAFIVPQLAAAIDDPNVAAAGGPIAFGLEMGRSVFFEVGTMAMAVGAVVLSQDAVLQEKQLGLTEWLLAKPVTRRSYLLAKLCANLLAILIFLIALPAIVAYGLLSLRAGGPLQVLPFLIGVTMIAVHTTFYLTLTLMAGAVFQTRIPILGLSLGVLFGGNVLVGFLQPAAYLTPWMLGKLANLIDGTQSIPPAMILAPTAATLVWSVVFILAGIRKLDKTEF